YTYRKYQNKFNVTFLQDGGQVSYKTWTWYKFEEELSNGNLDDQITTANIPFQLVRSRFGDTWLGGLFLNLFASMGESHILTTKKAEELCWGYEDGILEALFRFDPTTLTTFGLQRNETSEQESANMQEFDIKYTGKDSLDKI